MLSAYVLTKWIELTPNPGQRHNQWLNSWPDQFESRCFCIIESDSRRVPTSMVLSPGQQNCVCASIFCKTLRRSPPEVGCDSMMTHTIL